MKTRRLAPECPTCFSNRVDPEPGRRRVFFCTTCGNIFTEDIRAAIPAAGSITKRSPGARR